MVWEGPGDPEGVTCGPREGEPGSAHTEPLGRSQRALLQPQEGVASSLSPAAPPPLPAGF